MPSIAPFLGAAALFSRLALALPQPNGLNMGEVAPRGPETAYTNTQPSSNYGSGANGGNLNKQWSSSTTSWVAATATSGSSYPYTKATYGSGSSNWGGSGYDNCVSQCVASFGSPPASYTPPVSTSTPTSGSGGSGTGVTHTVIVAPTQGVFRYVPFALNASVGDTIQFTWGANKHTVTKSSQLLPCNKTLDSPFTSGEQNKGFTFTQVVNDTSTTFFYCGTPTHCDKGMFGIINPPNAFGTPMSFSSMVQNLSSNNPDIGAYVSVTKANTANHTGAAGWGGNLDMSSLPGWSHSRFAENVLYTRNFLAQNPEVLRDDGFINLGAVGTTPLMIPQDVAAALSYPVASTPASSVPTTSSPEASSAITGAPSTGAESLKNRASSLRSPQALIGLVFIATFLAL